MEDYQSNTPEKESYGLVTRSLAVMCHNCGICPFAERRPGSAFQKVMRWHRTWCPARIAHSKIYGEKQFS